MTITLTPMALVGALIFILGVLLALALVKRRVGRLRAEAATFRLVAEESGDGLILQARDSRILWANSAYAKMMGYAPGALIGRYPLEFALPPELAPPPEETRAFRFDPTSDGLGELETKQNVRQDGTRFMNQLRVNVVGAAEKEELFVTSCRDVTGQMEREQQLLDAHHRIAHQARTDLLTGLSSRSHMTDFLEDKIPGIPFALFAIDLDEFKSINDTHGHAAGDAVLRHTGAAVRDCMQDGWVAARMGGDEFVIVVPDVTTMSQAARVAITVRKRIETRLPWRQGTLLCKASVGAALHDGGQDSMDRLMTRADIALYAAKGRKRSRVALFNENMRQSFLHEAELRKGLATAIRTETLDFHLQPTVCLRTRELRGYEVLLRWTHPALGPVPPDKVVSLLGEMGLLGALDRIAARAALDAWCAMRDAGFADALIGFNLSPGTLDSGEFVDFLLWEADALEVPHGQIIIEVLETMMFAADGTGEAPAQISRLRAAGFRPLLDDFGVGYAGLSHLAGLDVEGLKIDRSLICRIDTDGTARTITAAILSLCHDLGFRVVAEGIETEAQLSCLVEDGCEVGQGFLFAKAMSIEDAVASIRPSQNRREAQGG